MDNLSSHTRKALVDRFGEEDGKWLWERFTFHYTPNGAEDMCAGVAIQGLAAVSSKAWTWTEWAPASVAPRDTCAIPDGVRGAAE